MRWVALPGRGCVRPPGSSPNPLRPGLVEAASRGRVVPSCHVQASRLSGEGGGTENSKLLTTTWSLETIQPPTRSPRRVPPSEQKTLTRETPRGSGHVCQESGSDTQYWDKRCSCALVAWETTRVSGALCGQGTEINVYFFLSSQDIHGIVTHPRRARPLPLACRMLPPPRNACGCG